MHRYIETLEGKVPVPGSTVTLLLPSTVELLKLLGFNGSIPSLFELISEQKEVTLPFSRATLFKFPKFLVGKLKVGKVTKRKFLDFIWQLFPRNQQKL